MRILKLLLLSGALSLAAACAREAVPEEAPLRVSFSVNLPEGVATKAIADGGKADQLVFFVFDGEGNLLPKLQDTVAVTGKQATVQAKLLRGRSYTFAFWAQHAGAYPADAGTLTIPYAQMVNDDNYDAFYGTYPIEDLQGHLTASVTLKRPFAQVNAGISHADSLYAAGLGVDVEKVKTGFSFYAPATLNLFDGTPGEPQEVETAPVTGPWDRFATSGDQTYTRAGFIYVLPYQAEDVLEGLSISFQGKQGQTDFTFSKTIDNVPINPNHQTHILGTIFEGRLIP